MKITTLALTAAMLIAPVAASAQMRNEGARPGGDVQPDSREYRARDEHQRRAKRVCHTVRHHGHRERRCHVG